MNSARSLWRVVKTKPLVGEVASILLLTILWSLFFWRVLTPNPENQVSLPQGDFSGQFVAFGSYQARRILAGEIPLWNPYNYGGHPFLADTQSAVFYPPRLFTIFVSSWFFKGWGYAALQSEVLAHYWLASILMYLFVKTVTGARIAGLVSAITYAYGGYLTGYPPLQVAILEAGVWLPLGLLSSYKAIGSDEIQIGWLAVGAMAIGLCLLAGHPQTALFSLYVSLAYGVHRALVTRTGWQSALLAISIQGGVGLGLAAIQILPGLEYTQLTVRAQIGFDEVSNGFPFSDLVIFLIPNIVTVWSPLYSGILALALAGCAVWIGYGSSRFWFSVAAIALVLSFGGGTLLFDLLYLAVPGISLFRGQERAAFVVAHSIAILAGLGTAAVIQNLNVTVPLLTQTFRTAGIVVGFLVVEVFILNRIFMDFPHLSELPSGMFFLLMICLIAWGYFDYARHRLSFEVWTLGLVAIVVFDLFSLNMDTNWESIPASRRSWLHEVVSIPLSDSALFRVDGRVGLGENNGTLVGLQDVRGISPLRLQSLDAYLQLPQYRMHEILAVKYVFTDWEQLEVPSRIVAEEISPNQATRLHIIDAPTPRAWMAYSVMDTSDTTTALGWLSDPGFRVQKTVILERQPEIELPSILPASAHVTVTEYQPERLVIEVDTASNGILVVSELFYPGWKAFVDGSPSPILRANAGLRAVALPKGHHEVTMVYGPVSFRIGSIVSGISVLGTLVLMLGSSYIRRRNSS